MKIKIYKMTMGIDMLVSALECVSVSPNPTNTFVKDIDIIINELKIKPTYINLDIYEVLVSCGHNLTWNQDYVCTLNDINWLKYEGKTYFLSTINTMKKINSIEEYNSLINIYLNLCELFELCYN
jgi:hypothetical protein